MAQDIEADYVVIGAGAMGMAFVDTIVTESDATVAIIDRGDRPGGHWTQAYPFVRLHQPSAFYGVNSKKLGSDTIDQVGWNAGLHELATHGEVCGYFDHVMQQQFLPSGRVAYVPMTEYEGDGLARSRATGETFRVTARKRMVNAAYMNVTVPSMRPPPFPVDESQRCVAVNDLPRSCEGADHFTVVGAGKTGMDACLWLLSRGVDPDRIRWIMPRDSWVLDRMFIQPGREGARKAVLTNAAQAKALAEATSVDDLFERLDQTGVMLRFDASVKPTMYRCATVSLPEFEQLRRIRDVVRMGRVTEISADELVLENGNLPVKANTLHVDCSADGLERLPSVPIFQERALVLQPVRVCQQVFSAALIAHVELLDTSDDERNALCQVIPHPDTYLDWIRTIAATQQANFTWAAHADVGEWVNQSRLNLMRQPAPEDIDEELQEAIAQTMELLPAAAESLQRLLAEAEALSEG